MTANNDELASETRTIQFISSSGSENWEGFNSGYTIENERPYFTQSGLIFYTRINVGSPNESARFITSETRSVLEMHGSKKQTFAVVLPTAARRITVSINEQLENSSGKDRLIFIVPGNDVIERRLAGTVGDQTFEFSFPIRAFVYYPLSSEQFNNPTVSISKIAWDSLA